jgi:hypothetical protein
VVKRRKCLSVAQVVAQPLAVNSTKLLRSKPRNSWSSLSARSISVSSRLLGTLVKQAERSASKR